MALVRCEKCGKEKSIKVRECPHCRHRALKPYHLAPCRECGALLEKAVHRAYEGHTSTGILEGTSTSRYVEMVTHKPCPKCGEPKPLFRLVWFVVFFNTLMLALTGGCIAYSADLWFTRGSRSYEDEKKIIIGVLFLLWFIAMWVIGRRLKKHVGTAA